MLAEADTLPGRELAGYQLTGVVGKGGMSTVYLGQRADDADTKYAIKVLQESPGVTGSHATFRTRFHREAEAATSLRHDHILPVLDYGEWRGLPYMVMPLATGGTLGKRLAAEPGPFPLAAAAAYAVELASALDYAHQHGVVHRDVKPSNALLDGQERLLLADFGIARIYEQSIRGDEATTLTCTGEVLGTPCYMAPEQFQGQRVGPAADIYALGVVLYLLATSRLPFEGETLLAIGMAHVHGTPISPQLLRPDLPVPAAAAILAALAKDPAWRFDGAGTLARAFAAGVEGRWTPENRARASAQVQELTHPNSPSSPSTGERAEGWASASSLRTGLAALAAVVLLGSGIAAAQAVQPGGLLSASPTSQSNVVGASVPERLPATATSSRTLAAAIRYDGSQVYLLWPDGSRRWTVWLDATLAGPPVVRGDVVYVTTASGTRYTLRASDGKILTRVPATVKHGKGKDYHGGDGGGGGDNEGDD
jgi:serine/threonine protein kinase